MFNVVITGATSFIGVHLVKEWLKNDCNIYVIVRKNSDNICRLPQSFKINLIELDMIEYDRIAQYIPSADIFYHLAWEGARAPYRDDSKMQLRNYNCSVLAMKSAYKMGCSLFVGSGSQAEYGKMDGLTDENSYCNPTTEYGKEKLHTCTTLSTMAKDYKMRFIWTRIFSIYGKYDYSETLIMSVIKNMIKNEEVKMTQCVQEWDYLHVEDAVKVMVKFAYADCESGIYNIASGDGRPLKEFVDEMKSVIGSESNVEFGAIPYGVNGYINLRPNIEKITKALNWKPEIKFRDGIMKLSEDLKKGVLMD